MDYVSDEYLGYLYKQCTLFVYPSLFEGFGMPPVEAMGFGKPTITTKCGSLKEVTLNKAIYINNPTDPNELALLMETTLENLINQHAEKHSIASLISAEINNPAGYGRIVKDKNGEFVKIVEHKDANTDELKINEINSGIYVFDSKILFKMLPQVKNENSQGEYYLPDVLTMILENKLKVGVEKTKNITEIQGVNTIEQLQELEKNN